MSGYFLGTILFLFGPFFDPLLNSLFQILGHIPKGRATENARAFARPANARARLYVRTCANIP